MQKRSLFDYNDYKCYLRTTLEERNLEQKGQRSRLAKAIQCQPAYLSQVLNGDAQLSPEQAYLTSEFLGHSHLEAEFFMNLVFLGRSGSVDLKNFFQRKIKKQLLERTVIQNRILPHRKISPEHQAKYYGSWHYSAIHVIVSLSGYRNRVKIAKALNMAAKNVSEALDFLVEINLLQRKGQEYEPGETKIHLGSDSPFIAKHHANWRTKTLQSLDLPREEDLHYSSVITCSKEDLGKIKEIMIQTIQKIREVVKESKDETMASYAFDLVDLIQEE